MHDQKTWAIALVRLQSLSANLPRSITEARVAEYHAILGTLETASGEDFAAFRIPPYDMKPQAMGRRTQRGITYSKELYGDEQLFKRQVDGAMRYAQTVDSDLRGWVSAGEPKDYWSMSTIELEHLAGKYGIGGYADQTLNVDRNIIIQQLLLRDEAIQPEKAAAPAHSINVGTMTNSLIQQHSSGASVTATSPNPKSRSFSSGGIAEKVVGGIITAACLAVLGWLFSHHWH